MRISGQSPVEFIGLFNGKMPDAKYDKFCKITLTKCGTTQIPGCLNSLVQAAAGKHEAPREIIIGIFIDRT
jgi:hypothetical protein